MAIYKTIGDDRKKLSDKSDSSSEQITASADLDYDYEPEKQH